MVTFNTVARCLVVAALVAGCSASILPSYQSCLHGPDGISSCTYTVPETILAVSRQACSTSDYGCLCLKSVKYNNDVRSRHGKSPIAVGNQAMLDNDIKHCREMEGGSFVHQDLTRVTGEIQCKVFCSGENIAKFSGPSDDPALKCMNMWENSDGHLQNILRQNDYTTIGIYTNNGWTYCTQTFGLKGSGEGEATGPKCDPVGGGSTSPTNDTPSKAAKTTAKTEPPSSTEKMIQKTAPPYKTAAPYETSTEKPIEATTYKSSEEKPTMAMTYKTSTVTSYDTEPVTNDKSTYPSKEYSPEVAPETPSTPPYVSTVAPKDTHGTHKKSGNRHRRHPYYKVKSTKSTPKPTQSDHTPSYGGDDSAPSNDEYSSPSYSSWMPKWGSGDSDDYFKGWRFNGNTYSHSDY
jgi:hypothetical protein